VKHQVHIIAEAEEDMVDIYRYVLAEDSRDAADGVLKKIEATCSSLEKLPGRGHVPPELYRIGVRDYLEIHCKPYRIIYQIIDRKVYVHCVLDGRRDIQEHLRRRILR
jgi:toxin ParE1/3/4